MSDLWLPEDQDPRLQGGALETEKDVLCDYLHTYRLTVELKCDGLTPAQMATRSVPPSTLSPLGLVRHLSGVEHHWFVQVMGGSEEPRPYRTPEHKDADFDDVVGEPEAVEAAWALWREKVAFAEDLVRRTDDLTTTGTMRDGEEITLREVLVHMIEEYARHVGHLDLLRECLDGRTGQ